MSARRSKKSGLNGIGPLGEIPKSRRQNAARLTRSGSTEQTLSISSCVVNSERENRMDPIASRRVRPIERSTWDGSGEPAAQAAPADTAIPFLSSSSSSAFPSVPRNVTFRICGRLFIRSVLSDAHPMRSRMVSASLSRSLRTDPCVFNSPGQARFYIRTIRGKSQSSCRTGLSSCFLAHGYR